MICAGPYVGHGGAKRRKIRCTLPECGVVFKELQANDRCRLEHLKTFHGSEELEWKSICDALTRGDAGPFNKLKLGGKYVEFQPKFGKKATLDAEDPTVKPIRAIVKDGSSQTRN